MTVQEIEVKEGNNSHDNVSCDYYRENNNFMFCVSESNLVKAK